MRIGSLGCWREAKCISRKIVPARLVEVLLRRLIKRYGKLTRAF
jgi:hypothetical protein